MSKQQRNSFKLPHPGPYRAIVKNNLDPGYMGGLEVALIQGYVDGTERVGAETVPVQYLSPFYGITNIRHVKETDAKNFNFTQKSYGMWFVPPEIGTTVLVIFIDGDWNQGYWLGCIQERYQNHMIPDIAYQELSETDLTPEQLEKYGTTRLPVAEMNKKALSVDSKLGIAAEISKLTRPVHPFADVLLEQGLLQDDIRGITSSSARREVPSSVFGVSTPGPLDKSDEALKGAVLYDGKAEAGVPVSRLGGSVFVMDDGDEDGNNELVRIRTRTGHQILLHNSADLIYITNSKGTAWIELTGDGKIDIYAQDSVSIRSENDFNLRADRNFNIEAGQNVNIKSNNNINLDAQNDLNAVIGQNSTLSTIEGKLYLNSKGQLHIVSSDEVFLDSSKVVNVYGSDSARISGSKVELNGSASILNTAPKIENNGSPATTAANGELAQAKNLEVFELPLAGDKGTLSSIMQRAPTHEPWPQHESTNPTLFTPDKTDNTGQGGGWYDSSAAGEQANKTASTGTNANIVFTSGSGDEAHFAKCKGSLQDAVRQAAQLYRDKTGKPIIITSSYRSVAEQQALYDRWKAAGGDYQTKPKAAGLYIPTKPVPGKLHAHATGLSIDSPNAPELDRLGILNKVGMYRPVPTTDPVHATMRAGNTSSGD